MSYVSLSNTEALPKKSWRKQRKKFEWRHHIQYMLISEEISNEAI